MPAEPQVLRIGDWRVDPELDELSREGQTIRVEPRTVQLMRGRIERRRHSRCVGLAEASG
jgi:hypothetical protein